jgi:hypothetical protein
VSASDAAALFVGGWLLLATGMLLGAGAVLMGLALGSPA